MRAQNLLDVRQSFNVYTVEAKRLGGLTKKLDIPQKSIGEIGGIMERTIGAVKRGGQLPIASMMQAENSRGAVRLTKREVQVLSLIAQGFSSKEAADRLVVSKRTVDFHLANVYDKLQVTNRVQAFRAATRMGLIPFEPSFGFSHGDS